MECHRNLELTLISAKGLKNTRFIGKLSVYAVASISGVHQDLTISVTKGTNPIWNFPMKFTVNEATVIIIKIKAVGWFVNTELGVVHVPIKDLMKLKGIKNEGNAMQFVSFPVIRGGNPKGDLSLSYKFGEEPAPALMATTSYNPPPEPPAKFTAYFFHKKQQSAQETTKKAAEPVASTSSKSSRPPPQRSVKKKSNAKAKQLPNIMAMATFGGGCGGGGCGGGGCGGGGCGGGGCGGGGCGGC